MSEKVPAIVLSADPSDVSDGERVDARSYHSINFEVDGGKYNTWWTWRLIPHPRPSVAMPKVRTKYLDIPGMNGQMDISEILTGKPLYENRKGSWTFYISRRQMLDGTVYPWYVIWEKVARALHGKTGKAWLEDEPYRIYTGRFSVSEKFDTQKDYSKITIEYTLNPFVEDSGEKEGPLGWKWDPFDFYNDVIDMSTDPQTLVEKEGQL